MAPYSIQQNVKISEKYIIAFIKKNYVVFNVTIVLPSDSTRKRTVGSFQVCSIIEGNYKISNFTKGFISKCSS